MAQRAPRRRQVWVAVTVAVGLGLPALAAATAVAFSTLELADDPALLTAPRRPTPVTTLGPVPAGGRSAALQPETSVAGVSQAVATGQAAPEPPPPEDPGAVVRAQRLLLALGHDVGEVDGDLGPRTTAALTTVQQSAGLTPHGRLDPVTMRALEVAATPVQDQVPASVVVDLSDQVAVVHNATGGQIAAVPVSTGAAGNDTPVGSFAVVARLRVGQSASHPDVHMDYFTVFNGDIGFHGIPWVGDRDARIPTPLGEAPASLGCIRMADEHAAWLYTFLPDGASVVVQD